jgi:hypothetical protein
MTATTTSSIHLNFTTHHSTDLNDDLDLTTATSTATAIATGDFNGDPTLSLIQFHLISFDLRRLIHHDLTAGDLFDSATTYRMTQLDGDGRRRPFCD